MASPAVTLSPRRVERRDADGVVRFGLIALATDLTSEGDLYRQLPAEGTAIHATRVAFQNPTTPENLRAMSPRLTDAARLLAPAGPLRAVCYSCTAASVVIGDDAVAAAIHEALPGIPVVTPAGAARTAFTALGARRLAVLTPYLIETSEPLLPFFTGLGFDITRFHCLGIEDDRDMARVGREAIVDAAIAVNTPDAEALFISCTALPAAGAVAEIEAAIGKPVVTSNQATAWAMARLGGFTQYRPASFGALFSRDLPDQPLGDAT